MRAFDASVDHAQLYGLSRLITALSATRTPAHKRALCAGCGYGGEEFDIAPARSVASVSDQHRHQSGGVGVERARDRGGITAGSWAGGSSWSESPVASLELMFTVYTMNITHDKGRYHA
jgi:hypothetical protein